MYIYKLGRNLKNREKKLEKTSGNPVFFKNRMVLNTINLLYFSTFTVLIIKKRVVQSFFHVFDFKILYKMSIFSYIKLKKIH